MAFRNSLEKTDNENNRDLPRAQEIETKKEYERKRLEQLKEIENQLDKKYAKQLEDYKLALYVSSDKLSYSTRKKLEKKYLEQQIKWRKKEEENLENELALKRKRLREEEQAKEKDWLEGKLERYRETLKDENTSFIDKIKTLNKMRKAISEGKTDEEISKKRWEKFDKIMNSLSSGMNEVITQYSKYQSTINTRLYGSGKDFKGLQGTLLGAVGITPYLKTQVLLENLQKLVETGISFNLEQRAFLSSISDKVATTFNAFDDNLLRIIRIQQADSTASRLGMESYLTNFLNNMFSDTSYLSNSFDTVTGNLVEATSQMGTKMSVQFEYIIQKWLGSLSSVGLSDTSVSNISQALGYLATGNVSGLESSGMQNLIVMAASRAGLSYADMLTRGISLNETNNLLGSIVEYLQEIGSSTNQVVKNQYASTFGVSLSDLRAAGNLSANDIKTIGNNLLSYTGAMDELSSRLGTIGQRVSIAEKLQNVSANAQFSLFRNIADSPGMMALWTITDMIQNYTGGINIPSVLGTGPNTTVENLMKLGIMGVGSLGMIGDIINGIGNTINFSSALGKLGGTDLLKTGRGNGITLREGGFWESEGTYIGQTSGSSFYQQTMEQSNRNIENQITNNEVAGSEVDMKKDIADVLLALHNNVADMLTIMRNGVPVNVNNYGLSGNTNV